MTTKKIDAHPVLPAQDKYNFEPATAVESWLLDEVKTLRAALAAQQVIPLFAAKIAARKWDELQEKGHRMQTLQFDGGPGGAGTIDPWGKVMWGDAATTPPPVQPMSDEQIEPMFRVRNAMPTEGEKDVWYWYAWGVSDGERAHGITQPQAEVNKEDK